MAVFFKFCSQNSTAPLPFLGEIRFYRYKNNENNLSPTAAVPSVLVCGEVFVFKPFGWERNFKKMIQQPVYHFYRKKFDFFSLYVAKKYSSSLWLLEYFFLIYPKQNSTTQLPFLGEVRFYRCNYNDKIFSPTTAVPSVPASLWRSFCFQAIWLGKKF